MSEWSGCCCWVRVTRKFFFIRKLQLFFILRCSCLQLAAHEGLPTCLTRFRVLDSWRPSAHWRETTERQSTLCRKVHRHRLKTQDRIHVLSTDGDTPQHVVTNTSWRNTAGSLSQAQLWSTTQVCPGTVLQYLYQCSAGGDRRLALYFSG